MSSHCMVNQFGRISRSHYIASTCPPTAYARLKKWTWGESQSESTSLLQYPPLQFSSLFLQHFFFNLVIYTYIRPQVIIDFAWAQTFQYLFPPSCTYSLLTTLWVKHGPKCRPVNCGSWGSSSDICPDTAQEHNVFSLKWNTELSTCKREELMISTYYYLNKPFKEIFTSQSESVFSCSRPPGRIFSPFPSPCSISLQLWQEPGKGKRTWVVIEAFLIYFSLC